MTAVHLCGVCVCVCGGGGNSRWGSVRYSPGDGRICTLRFTYCTKINGGGSMYMYMYIVS